MRLWKSGLCSGQEPLCPCVLYRKWGLLCYSLVEQSPDHFRRCRAVRISGRRRLCEASRLQIKHRIRFLVRDRSQGTSCLGLAVFASAFAHLGLPLPIRSPGRVGAAASASNYEKLGFVAPLHVLARPAALVPVFGTARLEFSSSALDGSSLESPPLLRSVARADFSPSVLQFSKLPCRPSLKA